MQPSFGHVISLRQQLTTKSSTSTPKLTSSIYSIRCGQVSSSGKNTLFKTKHLDLRHWLLWKKSLADRPCNKKIDSKKGFYRCFQLHHLWQRRNPTIMSLHCFGRRHKSPNSFNDLWCCLLNSSIIRIPSLFETLTSNLRLHSVFYSSSANYGWTCHRGTDSICDQGL